MSNFKVTRELVQELAETGSAQLLSGPNLPTAHNFLDEQRERLLLPGELSEEEAVRRANQTASSRALDASREILEQVLYEIYMISLGNSPFVTINPVITAYCQMSEKKDPLDLTVDNNLSVLRFHQDRDNSMWGASILRPLLPVEGEELIVAGRGIRPKRDMLKTYRYADGPILIAQRGFGEVLVGPEASRNAVWHRGQRSEAGYLGLTDAHFRTPLVRNQAIRDAEYRFTNNYWSSRR